MLLTNDTENDCDEDGDKCDGKITELKIKKNKV